MYQASRRLEAASACGSALREKLEDQETRPHPHRLPDGFCQTGFAIFCRMLITCCHMFSYFATFSL